MKIKCLPAMLVACLSILNLQAQKVYINEIMAKNRSVLQDEDGDFSDWIELYNDENFDVQLEGYHLSDDRSQLDKWTFPSVKISAKGFLIVFASDKDRLAVAELHTNFKIASEGEAIFLINPLGIIHDSVPPKSLEEDESYGVIREGINILFTQTAPTPWGMNFFKEELHFFPPSGFYEKPVFLKSNSILKDSIYCSLSGKNPDTNSVLLTDSILIDFSTDLPNRLTDIPTSADDSKLSFHGWFKPKEQVEKARVVRCATFSKNKQLSDVFSASYFIEPGIFDKYDMPVISLITDDENFFDDSTGIYVPGIHFNPNSPEWSGNFFQSGYDWERPIQIDFFENDGFLAFSQNAGVRIHGGKTRQAAQKSLKFYGRNQYDSKFFNYQFLPEKSYDNYRQFMLRTTMGAWRGQSVIKDAAYAQIVKDFDMEVQGYQPAAVFLNGEYWGIQTIRERADEGFPAMVYDLPVDSIALIQNQLYETTSTDSWDDFKNLLDFIEQNDLSESANYEVVKEEIDISSFIDYYVAETFFANYDWPGNNMKQWRFGKNGKWRYVLFDLDGGLDEIDYNMFEHATLWDPSVSWPNPTRSTFIFRNLIKNEAFVTQFLDRYKTALETNFHPSNSLKILEEVRQKYDAEMPRHIKRWQFPDSYDHWNQTVRSSLLRFLMFRPCKVVEQIREFFDVPDFNANCADTLQAIMNKQDVFFLAPNPTDGFADLVNNSEEILEGELLIFSIGGKLIRKEGNFKMLPKERILMNFSDMVNGSYFLKFKTQVDLPVLRFLLMK